MIQIFKQRFLEIDLKKDVRIYIFQNNCSDRVYIQAYLRKISENSSCYPEVRCLLTMGARL